MIKLNLRAKTGYHSSDPNANAITFININKIDYYFDESYDGYKSVICINGREFKCVESLEEITEKIELAKIADSVK